MVLPSTFIKDDTGGGTWMSSVGTWKRLDFVVVPFELLHIVQLAGTDLRINLDISLRVDHRATHVLLHALPEELHCNFP
jgi:hypothetical protein